MQCTLTANGRLLVMGGKPHHFCQERRIQLNNGLETLNIISITIKVPQAIIK